MVEKNDTEARGPKDNATCGAKDNFAGGGIMDNAVAFEQGMILYLVERGQFCNWRTKK
jgi:hypothetical protein